MKTGDHVGIAITFVVIAAFIPSGAVLAQSRVEQGFDIPSEDLATALDEIARRSGRQIVYGSEIADGKSSSEVRGRFTADEAIRRAIAGTSISATFGADGVILRGRSEAPAVMVGGTTATTIVVTGTRIAGTEIASPLTIIDRTQMSAQGEHSLSDVATNLPSNFTGGQNPGVGFGAGSSTNGNVNSAVNLDLRGLGPDATLTLLNGHRLAYGAANQGVDISSIPFAAVDHIEILADGASALYGSDAVAGVANIILRKDYDGIGVSTHLGAATDGGDEEKQVGAIVGTIWAGGGIYATYEHQESSRITARQRSFTTYLDDTSTVYPYIRQDSIAVSAHQSLSSALEFFVDGLFSRKVSVKTAATAKGSPYYLNGYSYNPKVRGFTVAPGLKLHVSDTWHAELQGLYGTDHTYIRTTFHAAGVAQVPTVGCYCNSAQSIEANAEGAILTLPAGDSHLAFGGGYRRNAMDFALGPASSDIEPLSVSRKSYYAYAELNLPLVASSMAMPAIRELSATGAVRYEDYPGMERLATPKLGVIYAPTRDVTLKGTWGKSFKAPTLYEQYLASQTLLLPVSGYGSTFPANSTFMYIAGGNSNLKPERAESWSITGELHPHSLPGLKVNVSYFNIQYHNRVVQAITSTVGMLTNPIYTSLINFDPTQSDIDAAIDRDPVGLENYTGSPLNPSSVVAIVDDSFRNVARQSVHGIDVDARYHFDISSIDKISFLASGTWLRSNQQLSAGQPVVQLAGTIFNPPRLRGRAGITWNHGPLAISMSANYIGAVSDNRLLPTIRVHSQTLTNITTHYHITSRVDVFDNVDVGLDILNLLNSKPAVIRTQSQSDTPFDSTNYNSIGRFVGVSIEKRL